MKIAVIIGTRPEIVKCAPLIRELTTRNLDFFVLHTGQHYSYNLDRVFFENLRLKDPKYNLNIGSGTHAEETGRMLMGIEEILLVEKPNYVLVQGDTNTVLAGALTAAKLQIPIGHVEAGLRSYDRRMPEEINRVVADHLSDSLFAPTSNARENLIREGIAEKKIFVVGNTVVDSLHANLKLAQKRNSLEEIGVTSKAYFLLTLHRQENVDDKARFQTLLGSLEQLSDRYGIPILYPIHPRAQKRLKEFKVRPTTLKLIDPLDYLDFINIENHAKLILTDSGGIQEEACILQVPCVTLRDSTERPETIAVGANLLSTGDPEDLVHQVETMLSKPRNWKNPFGAGDAAVKIIQCLLSIFHDSPK